MKLEEMLFTHGRYPSHTDAPYENAKITFPIYRFDYSNTITKLNNIEDKIRTYNKNALRSLLLNTFGHSYELDQVLSVYDQEEWIQYYMTHTISDANQLHPDQVDSLYDEIKLNTVGHIVSEEHPDDYGYMQKNTMYGGFIPLRETTESIVKIVNNTLNNHPLFIFRIDDMDLTTLQSFRMYDKGVDISSQTLIIIRKHIYAFYHNQWMMCYST